MLIDEPKQTKKKLHKDRFIVIISELEFCARLKKYINQSTVHFYKSTLCVIHDGSEWSQEWSVENTINWRNTVIHLQRS